MFLSLLSQAGQRLVWRNSLEENICTSKLSCLFRSILLNKELEEKSWKKVAPLSKVSCHPGSATPVISRVPALQRHYKFCVRLSLGLLNLSQKVEISTLPQFKAQNWSLASAQGCYPRQFSQCLMGGNRHKKGFYLMLSKDWTEGETSPALKTMLTIPESS